MKVALFILLLAFSLSAFAADEIVAPQSEALVEQEDVTQAPAAPAEALDLLPSEGMPSVEDLMLKKMDLVEKVEKIQRIEAVVDGATPQAEAQEQVKVDRNAYRPLRDEDGKQIQATPPFTLNRGN